MGNGFVSKLNFNSFPLRTSPPLPSIVAMSTPPSVPVCIVHVRCPFRPPRSCCRRCKLPSGEELCQCMIRSVLPPFISFLLFFIQPNSKKPIHKQFSHLIPCIPCYFSFPIVWYLLNRVAEKSLKASGARSSYAKVSTVEAWCRNHPNGHNAHLRDYDSLPLIGAISCPLKTEPPHSHTSLIFSSLHATHIHYLSLADAMSSAGTCADIFLRMPSCLYISPTVIVGHVAHSAILMLTRCATVRVRW